MIQQFSPSGEARKPKSTNRKTPNKRSPKFRSLAMKFQLSPAPGCAGSYRKETWVPSPMILASNSGRAVTVKERDPITDRDVFGSLRRQPNRLRSTGFVGTGIGMPVPLLRSHGSVSDDSRMILYPNEVSGQGPSIRLTQERSGQREHSWVTVFPVSGSRKEECVSSSGISTKRLCLSRGWGIRSRG